MAITTVGVPIGRKKAVRRNVRRRIQWVFRTIARNKAVGTITTTAATASQTVLVRAVRKDGSFSMRR